MKQLKITIPEELHTRFKEKAMSEGRSITWILKQAILTYLEDKPQGRGRGKAHTSAR